MSLTAFFKNLIGEKKIHVHFCISLSTGSEKIFTSNIWYIHYVYMCAEKAMAAHSSTLAWKIPWMEESGRVQPMGLQRVRHD